MPVQVDFVQDSSRGRHGDGISPFERIRILDPAPDQKMVGLAVSNLAKEFPAMRGIEVAAWSAYIDTSPDLVPIISTVENCPA